MEAMLQRRLVRFVSILLVVLSAPLIAGAQWMPTSGPSIAFTRCFGTSKSHIFAATLSNEMFCSSDGGDHWQNISSGLPADYVSAIASTDVAGTTTIFAGTDHTGIFSSTDFGDTWLAANASLTSAFNTVQVFAVRGPKIFAGTSNGIVLSPNNGSTWIAVDSQFVRSITALTVNATSVFAGVRDVDLVRSTDDGATWDSRRVGLDNLSMTALAANSTNVFMATSNIGQKPGGVYRSTDNGDHWDSVFATPSYRGSVISMAVSGTTILIGTSPDGVFRSTDDGTTWTKANAGLFIQPAGAVAIEDASGSGTRFYAGILNGGPVFCSTDEGANWLPKGGNGMTIGGVLGLESIGTNLFVEGAYIGLFRSRNDGTKWTVLPSGGVSVALRGNELFSTNGMLILHSKDSGSTWDTIPLNPNQVNINSVKVFGSSILSWTSDGLYHSSNDGASWTNPKFPLLANSTTTLGGIPYGYSFFQTVSRSTDDGATWQQCGTIPTTNKQDVLCLFGHGTDLYAGTNGLGVLHSTDSGSTWSPKNTGLTGKVVQAFAISDTNLFAATDRGVFLSTNKGALWREIDQGVGDSNHAQCLYVHGQYLFCGFSGVGVWRRKLSDFGPARVASSTAANALACYPNPVKGRATISLSSPSRSEHTRVSIVTVLGVEVARLFNGELPAGIHTFEWNPSGVPAGSYYCEVRHGGSVDRISMMVVR